MAKTLYFVNRIDCEATQPAVKDAALGRRATLGYAQVLESHQLKGTFYAIPSEVKAHPEVYRDLRARGHEVGLHVHGADLGYQEFLGVYGPDEQRQIVGQSTDLFEQAMGYRPDSICLGYGSSNDHTRPVLVDLGYRHGLTQIPGRALPECASVAVGAPQDPHYPHRWNRVLKGDLDFVELPGTYDQDSRLWGGKHPQDLRIELVDAKNHYYTVLKHVQRVLREAPPIMEISTSTHNTFDYSDAGNFRRQTLEGVIGHVFKVARDQGVELVAATHAQVAQAFRAAVPLTPTTTNLTLDRRGYAAV
jgi:peptidoglycan/xylan/chitin deacetylase (PgdA/CDA1 family)